MSISGGLSTNEHLCGLPLLSTTALGSSKPEQGKGARKGGGKQPKAGASFLSWVERACGAAGLLSQEQALPGTGWGGQAEL